MDNEQLIDNVDQVTAFHNAFEAESKAMLEPVGEALLEGPMSCTREELVAQVIMENLFPHPCDVENDGEWPAGRLTTDQKRFLVGVASHMGPDFTQALYHAAVFMTKVA